MRLFDIFKARKNGIIISQYSSQPKYLIINGVTYDLDKPSSIRKLPMFDDTFLVWGETRSMPELLRRHAYEIYDKNWELFDASIEKAAEYEQFITSQSCEDNYACPRDIKKPTNFIKSRNDDIDKMDGYQFEDWCVNLLQQLGFNDVQRNGKSGDQGVDILAEKDGIKYAIQCKCYSSDLGNTPIQEVYAGKNFYRCHVGAVMTNRYFTAGGWELARATGVLLWDRNWLEKAHEKVKDSSDTVSKITNYQDELLPAAVDVFLSTNFASVSTLQRALKIGYARAARIIDEMEELGIVGPFQGSKPRVILITKEDWDAMR